MAEEAERPAGRQRGEHAAPRCSSDSAITASVAAEITQTPAASPSTPSIRLITLITATMPETSAGSEAAEVEWPRNGSVRSPPARRGHGHDAAPARQLHSAERSSRSSATQPPGALGLRRAAGLPHRPLPGQGDGPEPAGVPLRQRHVRAAVEPQLYRPRPDHRRRGPRHRHARRLLRQRRRAARPGPEPHAAAALPRGDGAAGRLHRRRGPRREGQGAARDPPSRGRGRRRAWPCARSTRPGTVGGEEVAGYLEEEGVPADSTPRPTPRCAWRSTTGAGRACRSTCAPASAWRARSPRSRSRSSPSRTSASAQDGSVGVRPNQLVLTLQPNEGVSLSLGGEDPRHADADPPGEHGVPLRHVVHVAVAGGLRAADPRRDARRRDAVHPQRRGRGAVAIIDPIVQAWAADAGAAAAVRGGLAGARPRRTGCSSATTSGARSERRTRMPPSATASGARRTRRPATIEAALRALLEERHGENASYVPARVLNLVCVVDKRVERRDRQPPAPASAATTPSRTIVCAVEPGGDARSTRSRRSPPTSDPSPGEFALAARDGDRRRRRAAPRPPRHDRRPARRHRPADRRVGAARAHRGGRGAAAARPGRAARLRRRARHARRAQPRDDAAARRATSSTSPGCARRRGASASPRPSTRRTCAPTCGRSAA